LANRQIALVSPTLSSPRHLAYFFLRSPVFAVVYALVFAFELYLLQIVVGGLWLPRVLLFLSILVTFLGIGAPVLVGPIAVGILVAVLVRLGVLATVTMFFVWMTVARTPLTLDMSSWYAGRSFAVLGFLAVMFIAAFYTSLGGKPLFGKALIED